MATAQPAPAETQREMAPRCARDMHPEMCPRYATRLHEEVDVVWYRVVHAEDGVRVLVELRRRDEAPLWVTAAGWTSPGSATWRERGGVSVTERAPDGIGAGRDIAEKFAELVG